LGFVADAAAAGCGSAPEATGNADEQAAPAAAARRAVGRATAARGAAGPVGAGPIEEAVSREPAQAQAQTATGQGESGASIKGGAPDKSNINLAVICYCPEGTTNCGLPDWQSAGPYCSTSMGCGDGGNKPTRGPAMMQSWSRQCAYYEYCLDQTDNNWDGVPDDLSWGWGGNCRDGYVETWGPSRLHCDCD
jgi:hypothetical protein